MVGQPRSNSLDANILMACERGQLCLDDVASSQGDTLVFLSVIPILCPQLTDAELRFVADTSSFVCLEKGHGKEKVKKVTKGQKKEEFTFCLLTGEPENGYIDFTYEKNNNRFFEPDPTAGSCKRAGCARNYS